MEAIVWVSLLLFVVGAAAGWAVGHFFSPAIAEAKRLRGDLDRLQGEHDAYRASVDAHFRKTADLVGEMTKSYAAVYDHLAGGARTFCSDGNAPSVSFEPLPGVLAAPAAATAVEQAADASLADAAEEALAEVADETPYADAGEGEYRATTTADGYDSVATAAAYTPATTADAYDHATTDGYGAATTGEGAYTMDEVDEELVTGAELPTDPDEAGAPEQRPLSS